MINGKKFCFGGIKFNKSFPAPLAGCKMPTHWPRNLCIFKPIISIINTIKCVIDNTSGQDKNQSRVNS